MVVSDVTNHRDFIPYPFHLHRGTRSERREARRSDRGRTEINNVGPAGAPARNGLDAHLVPETAGVSIFRIAQCAHAAAAEQLISHDPESQRRKLVGRRP